MDKGMSFSVLSITYKSADISVRWIISHSCLSKFQVSFYIISVLKASKSYFILNQSFKSDANQFD